MNWKKLISYLSYWRKVNNIMLVNVNELKQMCEMLINKAIEAGFQEVELDKDYYWVIASEHKGTVVFMPRTISEKVVNNKPNQLTNFQLSNCFCTICEIM